MHQSASTHPSVPAGQSVTDAEDNDYSTTSPVEASHLIPAFILDDEWTIRRNYRLPKQPRTTRSLQRNSRPATTRYKPQEPSPLGQTELQHLITLQQRLYRNSTNQVQTYIISSAERFQRLLLEIKTNAVVEPIDWHDLVPKVDLPLDWSDDVSDISDETLVPTAPSLPWLKLARHILNEANDDPSRALLIAPYDPTSSLPPLTPALVALLTQLRDTHYTTIAQLKNSHHIRLAQAHHDAQKRYARLDALRQTADDRAMTLADMLDDVQASLADAKSTQQHLQYSLYCARTTQASLSAQLSEADEANAKLEAETVALRAALDVAQRRTERQARREEELCARTRRAEEVLARSVAETDARREREREVELQVLWERRGDWVKALGLRKGYFNTGASGVMMGGCWEESGGWAGLGVVC